MVELPAPLRPWREPLSLFGPEVLGGLGPWLGPLAVALGSVRRSSSTESGEPDGISGLTRRGSYQRLLLSEWALALEAPLEFVRRAIAGEHVFLARAYQDPHGARTSVALLDCGPQQLGAPRLAQLAALVVLQQRAADDRAEFRFGVLQDEQHGLHVLDRPGVAAWLRARSWSGPPESLDAWRSALEEVDAGDVWIVGSRGLDDAARSLGAGLLELVEVPSDQGRVLEARTHRRGSSGAVVQLRLPGVAVCKQILRAPLASQRPRGTMGSFAPRRGVGQLTLDGRRLLLLDDDGVIEALHVPGSVFERRGRTGKLQPAEGHELMGADRQARHFIAIAVASDGELLLRGSGLVVPGLRANPNSIGAIIRTGQRLPESFSWLRGQLVTTAVTECTGDRFVAYLHDHAAQLWCLDASVREDGTLHATFGVVDRACRSLQRPERQQLVWVSLSAGRVLSLQQPYPDSVDLPGGAEVDDVVFGWMPSGRLPPVGVPLEDGGVRVVDEDGYSVEMPTIAGRNLGLRRGPIHTAEGPSLIVLGADRRAIYQITHAGKSRVYESTAPITETMFVPKVDRLVARTESDDVFVFDLERGQVVLRLRHRVADVPGSVASPRAVEGLGKDSIR